MDTGIRYPPLIPGLVPEIEERDAAHFNGYTWLQWQQLGYWDKVDAVAYVRLRKLIDMHKEDAVSAESKRRARRSK